MKTRIVVMAALTLFLIGPWAGPLPAAGVGATYVKTLGQTNVKGAPFKTAGYRLSTDAQGNVYLGGIVNFPWSVVTKIAADGRVIWETPCGGYYPVVTAIDGDNLYAMTGSLLKRFSLAAGKEDTDFGREWQVPAGKPAPVVRGMRAFSFPRAMLFAGPHLYVVDFGADELRRLDKATGEDRPFQTRLMVVQPVDLALGKNGNLLLLTRESLLEIDPNGKPVKVPRIDGLAGAVAIEVDPATGNLWIGVGGNSQELVNQVVEYSADGKPTGTRFGRGGGFSGKWSADSFTFGTGEADFARDPTGGFWVNEAGYRTAALPVLVHLDKTGKPDRTFWGADGSAMAVDGNLSVYVGANYKISWDNQIAWTSGLVDFGDLKQFPTTLTSWWYVPGRADEKTVVTFNPPASQVLALAAETGALVEGPFHAGPAGLIGQGGDSVYYLVDGKFKRVKAGGLDKPEVVLPVPAEWKVGPSGFAVSDDGERFYFISNGKPVCYRKDGTKVWENPTALNSTPMACRKNVLFVRNGADAGVLALDASTGDRLGVFGDKEVDGRLPLRPKALAVRSKDGKDYLFVAGDWQIQVFEFKTE